MSAGITLIRGILDDISGLVSSVAYRVFTAFGRPDEILRGRLYQHYGFRSVPPKGVEVLTLQQGNSNVSVAEMDGQTIGNKALESGDTYLYSSDNNFVWLTNKDSLFSVFLAAKKNIVISTSDGDISINNLKDTGDINIEVQSNGHINIAGVTEVGNGPTFQVVATKAFKDAVEAYLSTIVTAFSSLGYTLPPFVDLPNMESTDTKVS